MTDYSLSLAPALIGLGATLALVGALAWRWPENAVLRRLTDGLGGLALLASLAAWAGRWRAAGHLPLFGTYESALSLALATLAAGLWARLAWPRLPAVWPATGAVAAAVLSHGGRYSVDIWALTISERSWVVDVHAVLAWAAFGCLAANAGLALRRQLPGGTPALDRALSASLSLGFLLHSGMMASGSFYKFLLFGTPWSFDPIETLGLVAWMAYGTLLHMHLLGGWSPRRLAPWCLSLFVVLVVSYRGIVYFPGWSTYHVFDMDLREHRVAPMEGEAP